MSTHITARGGLGPNVKHLSPIGGWAGKTGAVLWFKTSKSMHFTVWEVSGLTGVMRCNKQIRMQQS